MLVEVSIVFAEFKQHWAVDSIVHQNYFTFTKEKVPESAVGHDLLLKVAEENRYVIRYWMGPVSLKAALCSQKENICLRS